MTSPESLKAVFTYPIDNDWHITEPIIVGFPKADLYIKQFFVWGSPEGTLERKLTDMVRDDTHQGKMFINADWIKVEVRNIHDAFRLVDMVNGIEGNPYCYQPDLSELDVKFGLWDQITIKHTFLDGKLNRSLAIKVIESRYGLVDEDKEIVNNEAFDLGLATNGIDNKGLLTVELAQDPINTLQLLNQLLENLHTDKEGRDGYSIRRFCLYTYDCFALVRTHLEREAIHLSGEVTNANALGQVFRKEEKQQEK